MNGMQTPLTGRVIRPRSSEYFRVTKRIVSYSLPYLLLIAVYTFFFRDVVFNNSLVITTDLVLPAKSASFHWMALFSSWTPFSLGIPAFPNWAGTFNGLIVLIAQGNQLVAEKLMLTDILFASFSSFYVCKKMVSPRTIVCLAGALVYAYNPATLDNFGTQLLWGYAIFPVILLLLFNTLTRFDDMRSPLLLASVVAISSSWIPQILPILPLVALVFGLSLLIRKVSWRQLLKVGRNVTIFGLALVTMLSGTYAGLILSQKGQDVSFVAPTISDFYGNYAYFSPLALLRLAGLGSPMIHPVQSIYFDSNIVGLVLPIVAFGSLIMARRTRLSLALASLASATVLFVGFVQSHSAPFEIFFRFYPAAFALRDPFVILMVLALCYCLMTGIFLDGAILRLHSVRLPMPPIFTIPFFRRLFGNGRRLRATAVPLAVVLIVLLPYFLYVPAYSSTLHQQTPSFDNPSSYSEVVNWLKSKGEDGSFRYLIVPTSHVTVLNIQNSYPYYLLSPNGGSSEKAHQLTMAIFDEIAQGQVSSIGAILGLVNVRFMVIVKVTAEPSYLNWTIQGPIRVAGNILVGDPKNFESFALRQRDLVLVANQTDFEVFENLEYVPHVAAFPSSTFVNGGSETLASLVDIPGFSPRRTLFTFGNSTSSVQTPLPTSSILINPNASEIKLFNEGGIPTTIVWNSHSQNFRSTRKDETDPASSFGRVEDFSIISGTGFVSASNSSQANAQSRVSYSGNSGNGGLFSLLYTPGTLTNLTNMGYISYDLRLEGAFPGRNTEFGLLDWQGNARRWYKEQIPPTPLGPWAKVTVNINNYTHQDAGFDIARVLSFQFTTYTSSVDSPVSMQIDGLVSVRTVAIQNIFTLELPTDASLYVTLITNYNTPLSLSISGESVYLTRLNWTDGYSVSTSTIPVRIPRGIIEANVTVSPNVALRELIFSTMSNLTQIFNSGRAIPLSDLASGLTSYQVHIQLSKPAYLILGESFDEGWTASDGTIGFPHFTANLYANGFFVTTTGNVTVTLAQQSQKAHAVLVAAAFTLTLGPILGAVIITKRRKKHSPTLTWD